MRFRAALLAVVVAVVTFLDTDGDVGPGFILVLLVLFGLGPLFGLTLWLWTANPYWGLGALLTPVLALVVIGTLSAADT